MMGMENLELLIKALEYIENNLTQPLKTESIAEHLYCSKSTIEKLFRYVNNKSIRNILIKSNSAERRNHAVIYLRS